MSVITEKIFEKAQEELNQRQFKMWLIFVYGYMQSSMEDRAIKTFEEQIEVVKRIFDDSPSDDS